MAFPAPEPLRGKHSLAGFCCGNHELDRWLTRYARQAEAARTARTFVTTTDDSEVAGFYSMAAGSVAPSDASERLAKGQPARRPIPVVLLARLAVDQAHQGKGLGRSLLVDAMLTTHAIAEAVGVRALIVHAIDDAARSFYARFGFEASPTDPLHLILLMKDLRKLLGELGIEPQSDT